VRQPAWGAHEEAGAKLTEIRNRLGHSTNAATDRHLTKLRRAKNRHADMIAQMFGLYGKNQRPAELSAGYPRQ
jgi:hypothetical protein